MPHVVRLPPLTRRPEMPDGDSQHAIVDMVPTISRGRRLSILATSDPVADSTPIDCILVFDTRDEGTGGKNMTISPSERRQKFEKYITKKQGLVLKHVKSSTSHFQYVKIHAPFEVLLTTAEKIRMRLPIEKIEKDDNQVSQTDQSCWSRFVMRLKAPFRLDPSLARYEPDYFTAIYSRNVEKFANLFINLRGSKESYFTSSERSLLAHELLSRAQTGGGDGDDDQRMAVINEAAVQNIPAASKKGFNQPGIDRLITKKAYCSYYPLHESLRGNVQDCNDDDLNDREKLKKHWATMRCCLKFQPLSLIRSYMGEKVAFYFALAGFYNQMLIPAALVGLIIFIYGSTSVLTDGPTSDICGNFGHNTYMCPRCDYICPFWLLSDSCIYSKISYVFDNTATLVFSILMSVWARWFIELWKRRQAVLQYEWDSMDFDEHLEPIRPQFEKEANFKGETRLNPVTGIEEPHISVKKRVPFYLIAAGVVLITMAIVCATLFATIVYRVQMDYILKQTSVKTYSSIIISVTSAVMNLICTLILSSVYSWLAIKLTNLEVHKYQSSYDDSLTIKMYLFQFVNFYSSLFYVAFFKGRSVEYPSKYGATRSKDFTEQCDPAGCLVELSIQLIIIMIGNQLINGIIEFISATHRSCTRSCCARGKHHKLEQWEEDHGLIDFTSTTLMNEYMELIIQFGFVTLFVVAFPLAPLFALINNLIEVRLDAWKFLSKYKRPIPFKASDIGIWGDIISAVSYIAVLTNAVVIAWTSEFIPKMVYRSIQSTGTGLDGYVNWTLSSFPIADYNLTRTMTPDVPANLTYCRYRDFREPSGPYYLETSVYWNVIAARLAFIVVFEHVVFFTIYLMQLLVPDVPQKIQDKIDHERYIDQRERWASKTSGQNLKQAVLVVEAASKFGQVTNDPSQSSTRSSKKASKHQRNQTERRSRARVSPQD